MTSIRPRGIDQQSNEKMPSDGQITTRRHEYENKMFCMTYKPALHSLYATFSPFFPPPCISPTPFPVPG
jgi:hypothetical protein